MPKKLPIELAYFLTIDNVPFMKVLIVGGGGREHAMAWRLADSPGVTQLYGAPGNPGMAPLADLVPVKSSEIPGILKFVRQNKIEFVVIGPEEPMARGLSDELRKAGVLVFGPSREAAQIESDKWFAKGIMRHQAIPTADAHSFDDAAAAEEYVSARDEPVVIKVSGLAGGKGVRLCYRTADALEAIDAFMRRRIFGDAGQRIVVEELLSGPECSVFALIDRRTIYMLEPAQDHKPLEDGDTGPMTGGMGAYSPAPAVTSAILSHIERDIFVPVIDGMLREGIEYQGCLFAGLMLTANGPKVLEFNCRFGDPETQPLMMRLQSDALEMLLAVARGKLEDLNIRWDPRPAVCVVATAKGYPMQPVLGAQITGIEQADSMPDTRVFHSGTEMRDGKLCAASGRVLGVTSLGNNFTEAKRRAYAALAKIQFDGMHYRTDIGHQAITHEGIS